MARKPRSQNGTYTRSGTKPASAKHGRAFAAGWSDAVRRLGYRPDYERTLGATYEYGRLYAVAIIAAGVEPPTWDVGPFGAYPEPVLQAFRAAQKRPGWSDPIPEAAHR